MTGEVRSDNLPREKRIMLSAGVLINATKAWAWVTFTFASPVAIPAGQVSFMFGEGGSVVADIDPLLLSAELGIMILLAVQVALAIIVVIVGWCALAWAINSAPEIFGIR